MIEFTSLPKHTKVWVYQANRPITLTEQQWIQEQLDVFTQKWAAHGSQLNAQGTILNNFHIVLTVTEDLASASGCSIDSSVRFVKQIGAELGIDFFDRLNILVEEHGIKKMVPYSDLKQHVGSRYFNLNLRSITEFNDGFVQVVG